MNAKRNNGHRISCKEQKMSFCVVSAAQGSAVPNPCANLLLAVPDIMSKSATIADCKVQEFEELCIRPLDLGFGFP